MLILAVFFVNFKSQPTFVTRKLVSCRFADWNANSLHQQTYETRSEKLNVGVRRLQSSPVILRQMAGG